MQKTILTVLILLGTYMTSVAQKTTEVVIFSEDGEKFYLILDGEKQNATPAVRVKMPALVNEFYKVKIIFDDQQIQSIDDNIRTKGYTTTQSYEQARQITYVIKNKGKGKRVLRSSTWSYYGDNSTPVTTNDNPVPQNTNTTAAPNNNPNTGTNTTTTTTTSAPNGTNMNMNMNVGTNGVSVTDPDGNTVNMNVNMDPNNQNVNVNTSVKNANGTPAKMTTTTTTSSSSTYSSSGTNNNQNYNNNNNQNYNNNAQAPASNNAGNGGNKCVFPMSSGDFATAKASITKQSFAEEKMKVAKQIVKAKCVNAAQVKEIMGLFSFEENKLEFAKFAYDYTTDKDNYFTINDAFSFSSSVDDLNSYLDGKK